MIEKRSTAGTVELRGAPEAKTLGGYALKFNTLSQNLGGYVETCADGLVDKSLGDGVDVLCRFQHDDQYLLGRVSAGTLTLRTDDVGLDYECPVPDTDYARNCVALAERGDLAHSSFAFRTMDDEWDFTEHGFPLRILRSIQLVDVAPVISPAYLDTSSGLRSLAEHRSIELDTITKAAAANQLGELLRADAPVVIDLGSQDSDRRQGETHRTDSVKHKRLELLGRK